MQRERRWVVLTDDFPPCPGGVATWVQLVASGLRAHGASVVVFARHRLGLGFDADGQRFSFPVRGVRGPSFGRRGSWWMAAATWWRLRPGDRVLASTWPMALRVLPRLNRLGIPLDVVAHGSDLTRAACDDSRLLRVLEAADRRFTVSRFLENEIRQLGFDATVLPAPLTVVGPRTVCIDRPAKRWGFVGRATPLKGGDRFLRLVERVPEVTAQVIGDGPVLSDWKGLADDLGVSDRVEFTGHLPRDEVLGRVGSLDLVFLLPRCGADDRGQEGLGLSLLEAAAQGVAVVGCTTGGVPEAVGAGLVLADPDDIDRCIGQVGAWWHGGRGEACRAWVESRHGIDHTIRALAFPP